MGLKGSRCIQHGKSRRSWPEVLSRLRCSLRTFGCPRHLMKACRERTSGNQLFNFLLAFNSYFFASITFGDGFFQFQDNKVSLKQAPGHNHENTIFHPGQCPFKCALRELLLMHARVSSKIAHYFKLFLSCQTV